MMGENEGLADIERLSRHEFDLDVEEQRQLQSQCEVEVQKVRVGCLLHHQQSYYI